VCVFVCVYDYVCVTRVLCIDTEVAYIKLIDTSQLHESNLRIHIDNDTGYHSGGSSSAVVAGLGYAAARPVVSTTG